MQRSGIKMTSSDDDIDPELKEGIKNIMKLRDEYDKLEGALRKLGVDSGSLQVVMERNNELSSHIDSSGTEAMNSQNEQIFCLPTIMASPISNCSSADSHGRIENGAQRGYEKYREMSLDYNKMMESADGSSQNNTQHLIENPRIVSSLSRSNEDSLTFDTSTESERNRPNDFVGLRNRRHLEIVEEVDESLISTSENGEDPVTGSYHPAVQIPSGSSGAGTAQGGTSSYSWVQMALPGGGIVSVPLECASIASSSSATGAMNNENTRDSGNHYQYGSGGSTHHAGASNSGNGGQSDVLTVAAGEPVTHFNLDQLLEIVQSFQLDTTMAGHIPDHGRPNIPPSMAGRNTQFLEMGGASGGSCDGKECDTMLLSPQSGDRAGKSSISGSGGGTSTSRTKKYNVNKQNGASNSIIGGRSGTTSCAYSRDDTDVVLASSEGGASYNSGREAHSCPSSPTETDCSSGFSTLRKRSVTVTEKIRTNRDGTKTQVLREYGCNTSSANDPKQNVSYQQDSYVYVNGPSGQDDGELPPPPPTIPEEDTISCSTQRSGIAGNDLGITDTMSGGSISRANNNDTRHHSSSLFSNNIMSTTSATSDGNRMSGTTTGSMQQHLNTPGRNNQERNFRGHIVRLNSIEPNTVMFNTKDYPILVDVSVPEIIDELEKQFDDKLCDLQGVRLVGSNVYICLSRKESLEHLSTYGFYVRGVPVKLIDITSESVVVCLTGVPHYITDATVTMLVSTFGIAIGEVERRFYKGVDTGERFVRLKPRPHIQVPDFVTVGGCKILIRILNQEETATPFTLQNSKSNVSVKGDVASAGGGSLLDCIAPFSSASQPQQNMMLATEADLLQLSPPSSMGGGLYGGMGHTSNTYNSGMGNSSSSVLNGSGITNGSGGSSYRAKPGHSNGTVNTTGGNASGEMSFTSIPASFMHLPVSTHTSLASTQHMTPSSHVTNSANNVLSDGNDSDHVPPLLLSVTSPKIRKSFGSRIASQMARGSPPTKTIGGMPGDCIAEMEHTTYLPGDTVDGIPTLSPPPYKSSSTTGSNSSVTGHDARESDRGKLTSYSVVKRGAGGFESSSLNQRLTQNEKQMMSPTEALIALPKSGNSILQAKHSSSITNRTNSSTSMGSIGGQRPGGGISNISTMDREIGLAHHRQMVGTIGGSKVIFEESSENAPTTSANNTNNKMSSSTTGSVPIASPAAAQPRGTAGKNLVANSKAVNGILRKGSNPNNEMVSPPVETRESNDRKSGGDRDRDTTSKRSRKIRDGGNGERSNHKSKSGKNKSNSAKLGSLNESNNSEKAQETDGEKTRGEKGTRSRSNSTKSSSKAEKQQEKIQKDLALTRDLPWCGCWGNGCL